MPIGQEHIKTFPCVFLSSGIDTKSAIDTLRIVPNMVA